MRRPHYGLKANVNSRESGTTEEERQAADQAGTCQTSQAQTPKKRPTDKEKEEDRTKSNSSLPRDEVVSPECESQWARKTHSAAEPSKQTFSIGGDAESL